MADEPSVEQQVFNAGLRAQINPWVFFALIHKESRTPNSAFDPRAQTKRTYENSETLLPPEEQAYGIAQLIPKYHPEFLTKDGKPDLDKLFNVEISLDYASKLLQNSYQSRFLRGKVEDGNVMGDRSQLGSYWEAMADYNVGPSSEGVGRETGYAYARDILRDINDLKGRYGNKLDTRMWDNTGDTSGYGEMGQPNYPGPSFSDSTAKHLENTSLLYEVVDNDSFEGILQNKFWNQKIYDDWKWRVNNDQQDWSQFAQIIADYNKIGINSLQPGMILRIPTPSQQASGQTAPDAVDSPQRKRELGYNIPPSVG